MKPAVYPDTGGVCLAHGYVMAEDRIFYSKDIKIPQGVQVTVMGVVNRADAADHDIYVLVEVG